MQLINYVSWRLQNNLPKIAYIIHHFRNCGVSQTCIEDNSPSDCRRSSQSTPPPHAVILHCPLNPCWHGTTSSSAVSNCCWWSPFRSECKSAAYSPTLGNPISSCLASPVFCCFPTYAASTGWGRRGYRSSAGPHPHRAEAASEGSAASLAQGRSCHECGTA